jgi:hypothetical protein
MHDHRAVNTTDLEIPHALSVFDNAMSMLFLITPYPSFFNSVPVIFDNAMSLLFLMTPCSGYF